ncbi:acetyl-CoA carboxylase biotin carboxyl carrier protein [Propylenella binzhouense]|uniref:Biotin carboxyl carrier protein of acetyl-CoA carboxylase n=1 Tax=Propylenella binzhouense TaxID=2555902 RepID=A0A964T723_9HYPH|nr:acetyl-CoA carboxylase biotin carboxyl carrier protein [Propylenella binzhouense]MYZ49678.1 acetyl-CoA carboxylase biotin carboxyl carrier protein [Propylenella binzhouense]
MSQSKHGIDKDLIRDLAALLKETDLAEIEIEQDDFRIRVSRGAPQVPATFIQAPAPAGRLPSETKMEAAAALEPADLSKHPGVVASPMVGTAYRAPAPDAKPFVEVGDTVAVGETILIVEAMKHMNEVVATKAGKVVAILVEDGQPVEYGEPLMIVE